VLTASSRAWSALALVVAAGLVLTGCSRPSQNASQTPTAAPSGIASTECLATSTNENTLKIGAILPLTGPSYLGGYAQLAAINKAVADVTKAGGIPMLTKANPNARSAPACIVAIDSGAGMSASAASAAGADLASKKVSVILTALSTEATGAVIASAPGTTVMSLTSTSSTLSETASLFRIGPPTWAQAQALSQTLIVDGNPKIALIGSSDPTSLATRASIQAEFAEVKGVVLYGKVEVPSQQLASGATNVSTIVAEAIATKPDAIVVVAGSETSLILRELITQKWKMPKAYLVDTNVVDYSKSFASGDLLAVQGTVPGQSPSDELKQYLNDWSQATRGKNIESVNYAAEAYDATILAALGATNFAHTQPSYISSSLLAVSGTYGGDLCYSFAECAKPLTENKQIHYKGVSSIGPFTGIREVSTSMISIYQYKSDNTPVWTGLVSVRSVKEPKNTP